MALGSVRHRLKARLEDGSPDADLELATKEAPGSGAYMALVRPHFMLHSFLLLFESSSASEIDQGTLLSTQP